MLAIGQRAQQEVVDRISAMGSNLLSVYPGAPNMRGRWQVATLMPEDDDAINELPNILAAVPELTRSEEHTSELQSRPHLVCRLLLEKKKPHMSDPCQHT